MISRPSSISHVKKKEAIRARKKPSSETPNTVETMREHSMQWSAEPGLALVMGQLADQSLKPIILLM